MRLRFDNIQSEILRGYQRRRADPDPVPPRANYVLIHFPRAAAGAARAVVDHVRQRVTSGERWTPQISVNLGLTYAGLALLRDPCDLGLSKPFQEGMAARAEQYLSDRGESAPEHWDFSDGEVVAAKRDQRDRIHAVVLIQGSDSDQVADATRDVQAAAEGAGAQCRVERTCRLRDNREHFGFVDGISQPAIEGLDGDAEGHGAVDENGRWRKIEPGELVLGYASEAGPFAGHPWLADGSFIALRKLEQDVAGFVRYLHQHAGVLAPRELPADQKAEWLAARLVGRWPNGAPLIPLAPTAKNGNDFRYAADSVGFACPHGAHVRRANPRDVLNRFGDYAERHRIVRRALMYAYKEVDGHAQLALEPDDPPVDWSTLAGGDDGVRRGQIFIAFNADLERQFEFVQSNWINLGETARDRLFTFRDPLTGANDGSGHFVIPGSEFKVASALPRFVTTRGGGYFFLPGLEALDELCRPPATRTAARAATDARPCAAAGATGPAATRSSRPVAQPARRPPATDLLGALRFSGWRPGHVPRERPAIAPEKRLLIVMAPIREGRADALAERLPREKPALDRLFASLTRGTAPLVHHARFVVVRNFWQVPDPVAGEPQEVGLPHREGYLLFVCWFDGPRRALSQALCRALGDGWFPLDECHGFPRRRAGRPGLASLLRLEAFWSTFGLRTAFSYEGYPASTDEILKALRLRGAFLDFLEWAQQQTIEPQPIDWKKHLTAFFEANSGDLG